MGLAKMRAQWRARDRAIHCQTHVGKQTVALGVEQDVLGLEVAVQHATTVHVFNRQDQLGDDEARHVLPEESSKNCHQNSHPNLSARTHPFGSFLSLRLKSPPSAYLSTM